MKGQQLFFCLLPGLTVVVLTTHPSLANTIVVGKSKSIAYPTNILGKIDDQISSKPLFLSNNAFVSKNINQQLPIELNDDFSAIFNTNKSFLSNLTEIGLDASRILNVQAQPIIDPFSNPDLSRVEFYGQSSTNRDSLNIASLPSDETSKNQDLINRIQTANVGNKTTLPTSLQQLTASKKNTAIQFPTIAQVQNVVKDASVLTESSKCPKPQKSNQNNQPSQESANAECLQARAVVAQNNKPSPKPPAPAPAPAPQPPRAVPPTTGGQLPAFLQSNPNPLQYPTKPEEVRLGATQPISLEQVLEAARRNNKQLQVTLLELERSRAQLREAQAELLPNLNVNTTVSRGQSSGTQLGVEREIQRQPNFADQIEGDKPTTTFQGEAQLTYNLYTSGRRRATIRQAEEQVRSSELNVENQSEEIRLNVTRQYYNLQQADEQVRINQSAVTNAQASLRDALALEKAGVGTRFDVLRFQVNLANSQQNLTNSLSQQRIEQRRLASLLSLPQSVNLSAADPVRIAGLWNQTLEQSIIQALQNRPDLQQQLSQRSVSEQRRRQALSQLGPQISLIASYDLLDQFNDQISVTDGYSVGVRASLNLYDGGAARARAAQESRNIAIAETNFANQRNLIRFEVEQAFSELQSNLENVQTANTALEQAREALRLARLRFQAGVGTQTDVIAAENDLTQSEGNRIRAILDYNRALAQIQRAVTLRGTR